MSRGEEVSLQNESIFELEIILIKQLKQSMESDINIWVNNKIHDDFRYMKFIY